jgi:protein-disulfide isomerase
MSDSKKVALNMNILYGVIIALLGVIAVLAFFVGKNMGGGSSGAPTPSSLDGTDLTITIIDDKRCTSCGTEQIVTQLQQVPFLAKATFERKDFSDKGIEDFLKENSITKLPAAIFDSNKINDAGTMTPYLTALPKWEYSLQLGSTFDPFVKRSAKGFLTIDTAQIQSIKEGSYIQGSTDAKVTWIEYSDIECPYCAKHHKATTHEDIKAKYGKDVNIIFQHFPLDFHPNAKPAAEVLECLAAEKGSESFYTLISTAFEAEKSDKVFMIDEAVKLGADKTKLEACVTANTYDSKITAQLATGQKLFGITGTPGNVLINNLTWEYEVISGAYPTDTFVATIDKLLK